MILNGIDLGADLYRENRIGHSGIAGTMVRSRNQTPLIFEQSAGLLEFDLVGGENFGTLTYGQIKAIQALAGIGAVCDLTYDTTSETVCFRTWEQPVIEYTPIGDRENLQDADICKNIRIKLMEA